MTSYETTFVDAIRKKYEKLTECCIYETFSQRSPNRFGANILFPAKTLTMDGLQISRIGNPEELVRSAGHVAELDLSCNKFRCWVEVFTLLRCLSNLESLNLSQNPLCASTCLGNCLSDSCTLDHREQMSVELPEATDPHDRGKENADTSMDCSSGILDKPQEGNIATPPVLFFAGNVSLEVSQSLLFSPLTAGVLGPSAGGDEQNGDEEKLQRLPSSRPSAFMDLNRTLWKSSTTVPILETNPGRFMAIQTFPRLTVLALNATNIPWSQVLELMAYFPNLKTLHTAMNKYGSEQSQLDGSGDYSFEALTSLPVFPHLHTLYYSDNGISSWWAVCRLGRHFPGLDHLVLLGNPLDHIPTPLPSRPTMGAPTPLQGHMLHQPFACLQDLGLSDTLISRWESIDALAQWMPKLTNLRLGNSLPLFNAWAESTCRAHVIARIPNLVSYNRSPIDAEERDTAEREFVRHFGQLEPSQRPARYWELERQHGRLEPLANIDLSPKRFVRIRAVLGKQEVWHELNLSFKVSQVKRQLCHLFGIKPIEMKRFRLFYFDQVMSVTQGPEELKFPNRALHSYLPETGDVFELVRIS